MIALIIYNNSLQKHSLKTMHFTIIILSILCVGNAQNFNVSLADPYLVHQKGIGIKAIGKNLQNDFFLSFLNGDVRKYLPDFSSYISINTSSLVQKFQSTEIVLYTTLLNGSFLNLSDRKQIFISNGFKSIDAYNYYNYSLEESYTVSQTIIEQFSFPINVLGKSKSFFIIACSSSMVVAYQGSQQAYAYSSILLLGGSMCTAAKISDQLITSLGNQIISKISFIVAMTKQVYRLTATVKFTFNKSSNHFDITQTSFTSLPIYLSLDPVSSLFISNGLLLVQSANLGIIATAFFNLNTSLPGIAIGVPQDQTIAFFYIYGSFYILQKTGLIKLLYIPLTNIISVSTVMISLPFNNYGLTLNSPINAFFILGKAFLYRAGSCSGQSYLQGNTCISYNCSSVKCISCPIYSTMCSASNQNTNSTSTGNNSAWNSTQQPTQQPNASNKAVYSLQSDFFYREIFQHFVQVAKTIMSIPGGRRILSPIFYYFGIFDDLFFYQFHDRVYGSGMNQVFEKLNDIQSQKWKIVDSQKILAFANVDKEKFQNTTDYQQKYNYFFFQKNNIINSPEGVWANLRNFFIVGLPVVILTFILGRIVFNCLFQCLISKLFRKFAFLWYLVLLIFDGNVQQFIFFQCAECKNAFSFDYGTKIIKVQVLLFGFFVVLISTSFYFLTCAFVKRLRNYFLDNSKDTFLGHLSITMQFGIKNLYFGFIHNLLRNLKYDKMVSVLIVSEAIFTTMLVYFITRKTYNNVLKIWVYILINFIKVILVLTMAIDYQNTDHAVTKSQIVDQHSNRAMFPPFSQLNQFIYFMIEIIIIIIKDLSFRSY